jgi:SPP1 family predicted phage head-tail adaptor
MDPGKLNRRVTIKRPSTVQDSTGQPVSTLVDVAIVWASIVNKSGSESIRAEKDTSIVQSSIRIRMRSDLDNGMQVHFGGVVYRIKALLPDEKTRDFLDLVCEVVGNG